MIALFLAAVLGASAPGHAAGPGPPSAAGDSLEDGAPAIFLSWSAPYGMQGARETITSSCDDSTASDTLYLTFDPGRDQARLIGIDANLLIRAAPGDTLGPFWDLSRSGPGRGNLRVDFEDPPSGSPSPWQVTGQGIQRYRKIRETGQLVLVYFVPADQGGPVAGGTRYFFARVILRHRGRAAGCRQPVCVGLVRLKPSYGPGSPWITSGARFVSRNSPGGEACTEYRLEVDRLLRAASPDSTRK